MVPFATFTEIRFTDDPDFEVPPRQTPFEPDEHPFRVLVHDSELHLIAMGTAALGPPRAVLVNAFAFAQSFPAYAFALILDRVSMSVVALIGKNMDLQDASHHTFTNPQRDPDANDPGADG